MAVARKTRERPGSRPPQDDRPRAAPRTGAKRTVLSYVAELPRFLRLLWGLISDSRVAMIDKMLVAGAIAYILTPLDFIPDFIPFLGEVDDVYLLLLSIRRLIENAGRTVVMSHWSGDAASLRSLNIHQALIAAAFFLPRRIRRRLRLMGRQGLGL